MAKRDHSGGGVAVVDLGLGNVGSVANMVKRCGGTPIVVCEPSALEGAVKVILTGVGAFDAGVASLHEGNWTPTLEYLRSQRDVSILGICLGMQLMCKASDEGELRGLGWFDATVAKIAPRNNDRLIVPHMGWNWVTPRRPDRLFPDTSTPRRFYFVHSYHAVMSDTNDISATSEYGETITAAISRDNLFGVQFHPEKSHQFGVDLMSRFLEI